MKKCAKCKINERFSNYNAYCRPCKNEIDLKSYYTNQEKRKKYIKEYKDKNKEKIDGWLSSNKTKKKLYMRKYNVDNYQEIQEYRKEYNKNNKDCKKIYNKEKYYNDINYKMKVLLRNRLYQTLQREKSYKTNSIIKLLGCSLKEFRLYLEKQFLPEMNWDNWGEIWELDHIKACSTFDLSVEENQKQCFHYTNHQPLFKTTEIAKSFGYINQIGNRNKYKN